MASYILVLGQKLFLEMPVVGLHKEIIIIALVAVFTKEERSKIVG